MEDQIDTQIDPKSIKIIPFKCVVCNGWGTVSFNKKKCHACQGKGYILIRQKDEGTRLDKDT